MGFYYSLQQSFECWTYEFRSASLILIHLYLVWFPFGKRKVFKFSNRIFNVASKALNRIESVWFWADKRRIKQNEHFTVSWKHEKNKNVQQFFSVIKLPYNRFLVGSENFVDNEFGGEKMCNNGVKIASISHLFYDITINSVPWYASFFHKIFSHAMTSTFWLEHKIRAKSTETNFIKACSNKTM